METTCSFEMFVSTDMTTRLQNREFRNQKTRGSENVISYKNYEPYLTYQSVWLLYVPQYLTLEESYILTTQGIYAFCLDLRTNSLYFPIQY